MVMLSVLLWGVWQKGNSNRQLPGPGAAARQLLIFVGQIRNQEFLKSIFTPCLKIRTKAAQPYIPLQCRASRRYSIKSKTRWTSEKDTTITTRQGALQR